MSRAIGLTIAAFGPLLVAGLLVPFRDDLASANVVLVFVLVVVCGAAVGTRWSGALTAVVAAMSYDFFFTRPYQSLKIDNANDLETTLLLLAIGLIVAELVAFTRRHRAHAASRGDEIQMLRRTAELVAAGARLRRGAHDGAATSSSSCSRWSSAATSRRRSPRRFRRSSAPVRSTARTDVGSPASSPFPVSGPRSRSRRAGTTFGRLVLIPDASIGVSIEERIVAVALVDQLGAALAADAAAA